MKKYKIVLLFLLVAILVCCLASCNDDESGSIGKVEITTTKSGTIDVEVYSSEQVAKDGKVALTPLVGTTDKSITDDATGMHRIIIRTQGEGTLTTSTDKATEGTTVTFTATPATNWRFVSVTVNGELVLNNGTSFVMPASDANVVATFADMRHAVILGDHIVADNWGELRDDYYLTTAYTLVEGQRYEFTVDYHEENHYYEDKDVTCRSKEGNDVLATVTKVGDGRYSFVAPDSDCWVTVTTHEYRHIDAVKVFTSSYNWGYSENDYTDDFTVSLTVDGQPYTYGDLIKEGAEVRVTLSSNFIFTVEEIYGDNNRFTFEKKGIFNIYAFKMERSAQSLRIKIALPEQYAINRSQAENGTYTVNKQYAEAGDTVTITATPSSDFVTASVKYTVDGENYVKIPLNEQTGNYSFTMPASNVTVQVRFLHSWEKGSVAINLNDETENGEHKVELNGVQYSYCAYEEEFIGETVVFRVIPNGDYFVTFETENGSEIKDLGDGYYSVVIPEENETVTVSFAHKYTWSIKSFKSSNFGNFLSTWTIEGSISGTHTNEETFTVAEGERLNISFSAKSGEQLSRLSIDNHNNDNRITYILDQSLGYRTSYITWIDEVVADSYDVVIIVSVRV